jgi:hypothetical protein
MQNITDAQVEELVTDTLEWAQEVSEKWTGTQWQEIIDSKRTELVYAVDKEDRETLMKITYDLARTVDYAEKQYNTIEG